MNTIDNAKPVTPLAVHRFARGVTQKDLAAAAGITPAGLADLEKGRSRPRLTTAIALSKAMGVEISEIFPDLD